MVWYGMVWGREALDHKQILEGLVNEGGEKVKTLDSNEMLESNDLVKSKFENCETKPERVLAMTTNCLTQQRF